MTQLPKIRIYNTLTRSIEEIKPLVPGEISAYCCGPTVYGYPHIGNMRMYVSEDIFFRTLRMAGYKVKHVMNITDVGHLVSDADAGEDKMLVAMRRENKRSFEIAEFYTNIFFDHCAKLQIKRPDLVCKATEHIIEMIQLIKRLEDRGMTYFTNGNVYFDISKLPDYGKLAGLDLEKLQAGARTEVDKSKKNPLDFVLWFTKSKFEGQELVWDSPWGTGYPGWHIECSAMAIKYLGEKFDIHWGGIDHIPVHHTNEIAQSEGATGHAWVSVWMHGEFLLFGDVKMSKSKGHVFTIQTIEDEGYDPLSYRMLLLGSHYRSQLKFSWDALKNAQNSLQKLKSTVLKLKQSAPNPSLNCDHPSKLKFREALYNNLNTAQALAIVWETLDDNSITAADRLNLAYDFDQVLGFGIEAWKSETLAIPEAVQNLVKQREEARQAKNWAESDRLRGEINKLGFNVKDSANGQEIFKI